MRKLFLGILTFAFVTLTGRSSVGQEAGLSVKDLGLETGFQDNWDNHYRKGRSIVAGDFDRDGRVDFFIGNPGDESFIFRNLGPGPDGIVRFEVAQVLLRGNLAFAASGADYDNDGDLDLFVGCGGLEGSCLDFLFRNESTPENIRFTEVGEKAGIRGPEGFLVLHASAGAVWGDYDRDGDPDLFVSVRDVDLFESDPDGTRYRSILWKNNGNGTFTDDTVASGLAYWAYSQKGGLNILDWGYFQNSSWIDADNDGDLDLFLNNAQGPNVLFRNRLLEEGTATFYDATSDFSALGEDLRFPFRSFASSVADFNNDGWQDLMLFATGIEPRRSPYGNGNGLFLNANGGGFYNAARAAGANVPENGPEIAMGCQVEDLNADGIPDLFIGSGNPLYGQKNRLLLSSDLMGEMPIFQDASSLVDFEPVHGIDPSRPPYPLIPPYPYRTHGAAVADIDGDGSLELAVTSGAMAFDQGGHAQEPNRLFKFTGPGLGRTFRARLEGNGRTDGKDAIGARAYVRLSSGDRERRVFRTVLGGSAFSAENELTLTFGLGHDSLVSRLAVLWPASGCLQIMDSPPEASGNALLVKEGGCWTCPVRVNPVAAWLNPEGSGCLPPPPCRMEGTLTEGLGPVPWSRVLDDRQDGFPMAVGRSWSDGRFFLEHPFEPGVCRISIVEPFGYLPVNNPVREIETCSGTERIDWILQRAPEGRSPRGPGYWQHQAKALLLQKGRAQESPEEMASWLEAIGLRYPDLPEFESLSTMAMALDPAGPSSPVARLRRNLAVTLLNLASKRLSSYTVLATGESVGDLVEAAYRTLVANGPEPAACGLLTLRLEALNQGSLF